MNMDSPLRHRAPSTGFLRLGWIPSKPRRIVPRKYVPIVVLLFLGSCLLVLQALNHYSFFLEVENNDCSPLLLQLAAQEDRGHVLLESIHRARLVASGMMEDESRLHGLSAESLNAWNDLHPCESRGPDGLLSFYKGRKDPAPNLQASLLWNKVLEEYSNLHRECMEKVDDITDYFLQKNGSSGCKFAVADVADKTEFGDKILVLASSLLYAILTQRVILIPGSTLVPSYMCEPFVGSSWRLNSSRFPLPPTAFTEHWRLEKQIFSDINRQVRRCSDLTPPRGPYAAGFGTNQMQPRQRFYCTLEQAVYSGATFVYLSGSAYTIPKLFATPVFRPALEALFPDRAVITRLLRSAFLPGDQVWRRVKGLDRGFLQPSNRRVGVELKYNEGRITPRYLLDRVTYCLTHNDILPNITNSLEARALPKQSPTPIIRVIISSKFLGLEDHLTRMYGRYPTSTGDDVGVVQVSQSGSPDFSFEADVEAFKEALLLSFSDEMLVTPGSTIGAAAQAYGALVPWFIDMRKNDWLHSYGTCERGQSLELCNHLAERKYSCPSDDDVNGKVMTAVVPYLADCLTIDHDGGIQLITSSLES